MTTCKYCGGEYSPRGIRMHEMNCKSKDAHNQEPATQEPSTTEVQQKEQIKEVTLTPPEDNKMEDAEEYQCSECGSTWDAPKSAFQSKCPGCGCDLQ